MNLTSIENALRSGGGATHEEAEWLIKEVKKLRKQLTRQKSKQDQVRRVISQVTKLTTATLRIPANKDGLFPTNKNWNEAIDSLVTKCPLEVLCGDNYPQGKLTGYLVKYGEPFSSQVWVPSEWLKNK